MCVSGLFCANVDCPLSHVLSKFADEELLRVADALSEESEESKGSDEERAKVAARVTYPQHEGAGRVRRKRHHSKEDLYFRKKERKKCIEAEKQRGEHSRIRQALFISSEKDIGRFVEDCKGDLGNIAFERLHKQDVPLYKKRKCGPRRRHKKKSNRLRTERHISYWLLMDEPSNILQEHMTDASAEPIVFIPLQHMGDATTESKNDVLGDWYRKEEYLTRRTAELNKKTQDNPHNDALWLEYAKFQMDAAQVMESNGHKVNMASIRSKMYSILEKGIEYNPRSGALAVELLKIAESLSLPEAELKSLWSRFLLGPNGIHSCVELWLAFLEKQKKAENDDFDALDCSRCYIMAIRALKNQWSTEDSSDAHKQYIETHIASLLTEAIKFHLESGMTEHGMALFQCFLEFNFFCPEERCIRPGTSPEGMFVEFFDSSSPMIGFPDAPGWSRYEIQRHEAAADTARWYSITPFSIGAQEPKDVHAVSRKPAHPVGINKVDRQVDIISFTQSEKNLERKIASKSPQEVKSEKHDLTLRQIKHAVFKFQDQSLLFSVLATSLECFGIYHPVFMQKHDKVPYDMSFSQSANDLSCFNLYYSTECMQAYQPQSRTNGDQRAVTWWSESTERIDFLCRVLNDLSGKIQGVLGNILDAITIRILKVHSSSDKPLAHAKMILSQKPEALSLWGEFANASLRNPEGIKMMRKVYKRCMTSSPTSDVWNSAELCKHMIQSQLYLGGFQWKCPSFDLIYPACAMHLSKERAMAALTTFLWFAQVDASVGTEAAIVQARKAFQNLVSRISSEYKRGNYMSRFIAILSTYAAFEICVSAVEDSLGNGKGIIRAYNILKHAMANLEERTIVEYKYPTVEDPYAYQYLVYQRSILASLASDLNPHIVAPSTVKDFILSSDSWNSPLMLKSFVFHQLKARGPHMLRRELHLLAIKATKNKSIASSREPSHFHIACTILALDIHHNIMIPAPVIWSMRIQKAAECQQPTDMIVKVCQDAVNSCPWSKSLWMLLIENSCQISAQAALNALTDMRYDHVLLCVESNLIFSIQFHNTVQCFCAG